MSDLRVRGCEESGPGRSARRSLVSRTGLAISLAAIVASLALGLTACQTSMWTPRVETHMQVASVVGQARQTAKWMDADIVTLSYAAATREEIATLRARCAILAAGADRLAAKLDQSDMFAKTRDTTDIDGLARAARELDDERVNLERDWGTLQVRLGLRTAEDAAIPAIRLAPGNATPINVD